MSPAKEQTVEIPSLFLHSSDGVEVPVCIGGTYRKAKSSIVSIALPPPVKERWKRNQYFAALAANVGAISFGTITGWSATALPSLREDEIAKGMSMEQETWIGSIVLLGALVSGPIIGFPMERFGRRLSMLMLSLPCLIGWALIYFAMNVEMIYAGRVITGIAGGSISVVAPIYIAETSDAAIRGKLSAGFDMGVAFGVLYIVVIGSYATWEVQTICCAGITVVGHLLLMAVPESPRYLVGMGKFDKASKALCWLQNVTDPKLVEEELDQLKATAAEQMAEAEASASSFVVLFQPHILKPCSVALMIHLISSLSAVTAISAFTVDIFASSETSLDEYYATMIFAVSDGISGVLAALVIDHCGRRPLLIGAQLVMTISFVALGLFFFLMEANEDVAPRGLGWLPLTSLGIYIFAFSLGTGPISYIMMGEILPPEAKGLGASAITVVKWLSAFLVTKYFRDILDGLGDAVGYWIFAGLCLLGGFYVMYFVPETNGKTLEEIQDFYSRDRKVISRSEVKL